mgnify:CR=1 FL=1
MLLLLTGCWLLFVPRGEGEPPPTDDTDRAPEDSPPEDTDTWVDPALMRPDYIEFDQSWAFDGSEPGDYKSLDGNTLPNTVHIKYYDERFFDGILPQYVCEESFAMVPVQAGERWGQWTFTLNHVEGSQNPCHFGGGPADGQAVDLGIAELNPEIETDMVLYFAADYAAWEPYLYAMRVSYRRVGWAVLLQLDEDMRMVAGDNCPALGAACVVRNDNNELVGPVLIWGGSLQLTRTSDLF